MKRGLLGVAIWFSCMGSVTAMDLTVQLDDVTISQTLKELCAGVGKFSLSDDECIAIAKETIVENLRSIVIQGRAALQHRVDVTSIKTDVDSKIFLK